MADWNEQNKLKIMSFNIRVAGNFDGENQFELRLPEIRELLVTEKPDVIGLQEMVTLSRDRFREAFSDEYDFIGCGRTRDGRGEGVSIAFRRESLALISCRTVWLSDTPMVPGSRFEDSDQSEFPRTAQEALFKPRFSDGFLRVMNTHLDHEGREARIKELSMLEAVMAESDIPAVLLGDFNIQPNCKEIADFTEYVKALGWEDATAGLGGTFHAYGACIPPTKIDYIFANCRFSESRVINTEPHNGVYYSDHYAVTTKIGLS